MYAADHLLAVGLFVAVGAFFSSSEIAVFSLVAHRRGSLADRSRGAALDVLREECHRLLVTVLVGNDFVTVAIAPLATALFVDRVGSVLVPRVDVIAVDRPRLGRGGIRHLRNLAPPALHVFEGRKIDEVLAELSSRAPNWPLSTNESAPSRD